MRFLTSEAEQKRRAKTGSFNPTREVLYQDPELLAVNPFYSDYVNILKTATIRPAAVTGTRYNQVSSEFVHAVHKSLSGDGSAAENLADLSRTLERLSHGGHW